MKKQLTRDKLFKNNQCYEKKYCFIKNFEYKIGKLFMLKKYEFTDEK